MVRFKKPLTIIFSLFLLFTGTITACQHRDFEDKLSSLYKNAVPRIQPEGLDSLLATGAVVHILDTRKPEEYQVSHLPGAHFLDYNNYKNANLDTLPKGGIIVVYCSVGYRSEKVGEYLLKKGYPTVYNIHGGIFQWKNTGHTVVDEKGHPTERVHTYNRNWSKFLIEGEAVY